ncbi:MAG: Na+/H+ antiporter subunit E [Rhizobiales bacterium]|nr:Na+/H+ antiporter subunit E [Hyphomicrobiales bacterium]
MTVLRKIVPYPLLSLLILALWLALNNSIGPGQMLLGAVVAVLVTRLTAQFWTDRPKLVRPLLAIRLFLVVIIDILVANWKVAYRVVGPLDRLRADFVDIPLDIRDPFVATILGGIVSLTPGTVSVDIDRDRWTLKVHGLDIDDRDEMVRRIKARYEAPLREILSC